MKFLSIFFLLSFCLAVFSSCGKEDVHTADLQMHANRWSETQMNPEWSEEETGSIWAEEEVNSQWFEAKTGEYPPPDVPYFITHNGISSSENNNTFTLKFNTNPNYCDPPVNECAKAVPPTDIHWEVSISTQESKVTSHDFDFEGEYLPISMPDVHTHWIVTVSLSYGDLSTSFELEVIVKDGKVNSSNIDAIDRGSETLRHTPSMILLRL